MAKETGPGTKHCVSVHALSERINRRPATIRMWENTGVLPKRLHGRRDSRRWRWWTEEQAAEIEKISHNRYPGAGLPWYQPDPEDVDRTLERMRRSRVETATGTA